MALKILTSYAHKALQESPWFTSKTDGYEGEDPVWVSGKFLEAYVLFKQRALLGRTIFSPLVLRGELKLQTSLAPGFFELSSFNFTFPNLHGGADLNFQERDRKLIVTLVGFVGRNVSLIFLNGVSDVVIVPKDIPISMQYNLAAMTILFVPDARGVILTVNGH
jgi:hypothetical protein